MAFSPTSGTFRSVPSPVKTAPSTLAATPATQSCLGLSSITEVVAESSPWTPDINNNVIRTEATSPPLCSMAQEPEEDVKEKEIVVKPESVSSNIIIHEDDVAESDEENSGPQTPLHSPPGPATPAQWLTRTITTTTTIPLHFSPMTPVTKTADHPLTPSTIAHAPSDAQSNILGEIALNKLPFDREAALEAIRQRRGRARSMAAGHGTPRKQMMEGLKERRDISAPVARVRR
ncbi:hypothetical protein CC78DRAFT_531593 [Lojkania enalia]|uniref:Uncharacterized protein n=1 Tax=Lojkania enalia TaxID=147567 RepID=A0A9P4KE59_9PLEO|nr:hypothetical protein CC78DRAFT_531593 [Didymosphaeria enalia]